MLSLVGKHANIVHKKDDFRVGDLVIIAMEYCNRGNLAQELGAMSAVTDQLVAKFFLQLLCGLERLQKLRKLQIFCSHGLQTILSAAGENARLVHAVQASYTEISHSKAR